MVRALGLQGQAYIKQTGGEQYLILKGNPGARPGLPGTRYLMSNPKVATFVIGAKRIAESAARTATITVIAYCGWRVVEELLRDQSSMARLLGTVGMDLAKVALSAGLGFLAGAALGSVTMLAVAPFVVAVAVGLIAGVALDRIDRELGLTEQVVEALERAQDNTFGRLVREVARWEDWLKRRAISHALSR